MFVIKWTECFGDVSTSDKYVAFSDMLLCEYDQT